jgi:hypothetical protein
MDLDENDHSLILETLDRLEELESKLLIWGIVDGQVTHDELHRIADEVVEHAFDSSITVSLDPSTLIECLVELGLVVRLNGDGGDFYRSRMAESVRLLFRLRQLFDKHRGRDRWQTAPTLVSDFRFSRRRREYPRRDISFSHVSNNLKSAGRTDLEIRAIQSLLIDTNKNPFNVSGFQLRATDRILEGLGAKKTVGTLVSAGTGSGKTLAFYAPGLSYISKLIVDKPKENPWVKCLAIYPRQELLKDQFSEVYREARKLDDFLSRYDRKIRIGAFFGAVPYDANSVVNNKYQKWEKARGGYQCPYMSCPSKGCDGALVWSYENHRDNVEQLKCITCNHIVHGDEVPLTRRSLQESPPDILFTTTEMLNRNMSDGWSMHLFGVGRNAIRPPEIMLLDEVHTYHGTTGAQAAFLLRRWRKLIKKPVSFVGLSATLRGGAKFFSDLTGLYESEVEEITPYKSELTKEGAEYLLALKGDPVSKTSLLSTTIQTCMLVSRIIDTPDDPKSKGLYGSRVFAFTDDIDVINRLYFGLLDAEGRWDNGQPNYRDRPHGGLAHLREVITSQSRDQGGQNWRLPINLNHRLEDRKRIERVSSQDPGVLQSSDIAVATASLEVGFNDPHVGAVIQHKAPRDIASFLQRKGRAGRSRGMRPWTIVVMTDYGRDRLAYQQYEQLFDPELKLQKLPLKSRYIQRIQSVYALIDYLGQKMNKGNFKFDTWSYLSRPDQNKQNQDSLANVLDDLLSKPLEEANLTRYLKQSLRLSTEDIPPLLWAHPRPLMTTVIPTASRRLISNWKNDTVSKSPLPEFAPATLFSDLNLPEVSIELPSGTDGQDAQDADAIGETQTLPILQSLRTFAPGRVSRRYGVTRGNIRHWLGPENLEDLTYDSVQIFSLDDQMDGHFLGEWSYFDENQIKRILVVRPHKLRPSFPNWKIKDTSNARLRWKTQLCAPSQRDPISPPASSPFIRLIKSVTFFTHGSQNQIEVRRFSDASDATINITGEDEVRTSFEFSFQERKVALGYSMHVDGLRISLSRLDFLSTNDSKAAFEKSIRVSRYFDSENLSQLSSRVPNPFQRDWLASVYLATISYEAMVSSVDLKTASENVLSNNSQISPIDTLRTIFQSPLIEDEDTPENSPLGPDGLRQELEDHLRNSEILGILDSSAAPLWTDIGQDWSSWIWRRIKATMAAAFCSAIESLCPEIDLSGLVVDIDEVEIDQLSNLAEEADNDIWITEATPGATGHIEEIIEKYSEDPRRFYSIMRAALTLTEAELSNDQLCKFVDDLSNNRTPIINNTVSAFRAAISAGALSRSYFDLRKALVDKNYVLFHSFSTALNSRVLRSGSTAKSDKIIADIIKVWDVEEQRLGIELDPRTIAFYFSFDSSIDRVTNLENNLPTGSQLNTWRFNILYGLLWPRGEQPKRQGLELYSRFSELPSVEPSILRPLLGISNNIVDIEDESWFERAIRALSENGAVTIQCDPTNRRKLTKAINYFATNSVNSGYIYAFARLKSVRSLPGSYQIDFELAETAQ